MATQQPSFFSDAKSVRRQGILAVLSSLAAFLVLALGVLDRDFLFIASGILLLVAAALMFHIAFDEGQLASDRFVRESCSSAAGFFAFLIVRRARDTVASTESDSNWIVIAFISFLVLTASITGLKTTRSKPPVVSSDAPPSVTSLPVAPTSSSISIVPQPTEAHLTQKPTPAPAISPVQPPPAPISMGKLTVSGAKGALVCVDGKQTSGSEVSLVTGPHKVEVRNAQTGRVSSTHEVVIKPGTTTILAVTPPTTTTIPSPPDGD
jgi:hypothetical protein